MVIMFSRDQAALLSIQLYLMSQVFAEIFPGEHRNELVSRGNSITFTCDTSEENLTQISWTRGSSVFGYSFEDNQTFSNFTSHRLSIDINLPSKLIISNAQHDDAGLYRCVLQNIKVGRTIEWNLTVYEEPEEMIPPWYFPYILTAVIGFLLCVFSLAVCLYRKRRARTPPQNPAQDQLHPQTEGEVTRPELQGGADRRTNNKRRSQYMERLNSIYGC